MNTGDMKKAPSKKAHLIINVSGEQALNLEIDVRYERLNSKDIKEERKVIYKDDTGRIISAKMFFDSKVIPQGEMHRLMCTAEGEVVPKEQLRTYQLIAGEEKEVKAFDRTESIQIVKILPQDALGNFLIEYTYEMWSENQQGLYKLAEFLDRTMQIAVGRVVLMSGSFTEYLGIFKPVFLQGKFVLEMNLVLKKKEYRHLLDIKTAMTQSVSRPVVKDQAKGLELLDEVMVL